MPARAWQIHKYKYYLPQMAPNGPQNDKNAIQTLQITVFHDNSGAAQIPQIQILFASEIAANIRLGYE